jgi:hypothetical protein
LGDLWGQKCGYLGVKLKKKKWGGHKGHLLTTSTIYDWVQKHKKLHLKRVTNMEAERIRASTKDNMDPFFDLLETVQRKKITEWN